MTNEKLKIIFVGMPDMALVCLPNLLDAGFNIVGIVPPKKTHETYPFFKQFCSFKKLNFLDFEESCNEEALVKKIKELNADIGVVCSYNYKLSLDFLNTTKMGYINCHPSKLPYYRGAAPYFHVINNGEKTSGITLHLMEETFDTGDIVYQEEFDLLPNETMGTIFNRTNFMLSDALIKVLSSLEKGENLNKIPQDKENKYIEASKVGGNFKIRWHNSIFEIERLIRACNPFYNAFSFFRGVNIKIIKARIIEKEHNLKFGQIASCDSKNILIAARGGYVALEVFQVGTWGVFGPKEFNLIFSPKIGEILM